MSMSRDDFREQMRRCPSCGALCDGDVCDESCAERLREEHHEPEELGIRKFAGVLGEYTEKGADA